MVKLLWPLLCIVSMTHAAVYEGKPVIGQRAYLSLEGPDIEYLARIDTGALTSSLHAVNIVIKGKKSLIYVKRYPSLKENPVFEPIKNEMFRWDIGSMVEFDTVNEKGEQRHICTPIIDVSKVNNAQGSEYRYVVRLGLKYGDIVKYKVVNLRDRSEMRHKLLIGRNWLMNEFLVDVSKDVE